MDVSSKTSPKRGKGVARHYWKYLVASESTSKGVQLLDGAPWGLDAVNSSEINITGSTLAGDLIGQRGRGAIRFRGVGERTRFLPAESREGRA